MFGGSGVRSVSGSPREAKRATGSMVTRTRAKGMGRVGTNCSRQRQGRCPKRRNLLFGFSWAGMLGLLGNSGVEPVLRRCPAHKRPESNMGDGERYCSRPLYLWPIPHDHTRAMVCLSRLRRSAVEPLDRPRSAATSFTVLCLSTPGRVLGQIQDESILDLAPPPTEGSHVEIACSLVMRVVRPTPSFGVVVALASLDAANSRPAFLFRHLT